MGRCSAARGRSSVRIMASRTPSAKRRRSSSPGLASAAELIGSPGGRGRQHVAALERALRFMARESERQPLQLAWAALGAVERKEAPLRASTSAGAGHAALALQAPARAGADLRSCWCRRALCRICGQPEPGRASPAAERARAPPAGRGRAGARRRPPGRRGPCAQSIPTAASAAWVGVEQLTAATSSISVRSVWCPTEAMTGTLSSATVGIASRRRTRAGPRASRPRGQR